MGIMEMYVFPARFDVTMDDELVEEAIGDWKAGRESAYAALVESLLVDDAVAYEKAADLSDMRIIELSDKMIAETGAQSEIEKQALRDLFESARRGSRKIRHIRSCASEGRGENA